MLRIHENWAYLRSCQIWIWVLLKYILYGSPPNVLLFGSGPNSRLTLLSLRIIRQNELQWKIKPYIWLIPISFVDIDSAAATFTLIALCCLSVKKSNIYDNVHKMPYYICPLMIVMLVHRHFNASPARVASEYWWQTFLL